MKMTLQKIKERFLMRHRKPNVPIIFQQNTCFCAYVNSSSFVDIVLPAWCRFFRVSCATSTGYYAINDTVGFPSLGTVVENNMKFITLVPDIISVEIASNVRLYNSSTATYFFVECWALDAL